MITLVMYFTHVTGYQPNIEAFVFLGVHKESGQWKWWDQSAIASGILDGRWDARPYGNEPSNFAGEIYIAISSASWMLNDVPYTWVKPYLCEIDLIA